MVWFWAKRDLFVVKVAIFAYKFHILDIFIFKSLEFVPDFSLFLQKIVQIVEILAIFDIVGFWFLLVLLSVIQNL